MHTTKYACKKRGALGTQKLHEARDKDEQNQTKRNKNKTKQDKARPGKARQDKEQERITGLQNGRESLEVKANTTGKQYASLLYRFSPLRKVSKENKKKQEQKKQGKNFKSFGTSPRQRGGTASTTQQH